MDIGNLEEVVLDAREPLPWSLRMKLAHDISKGMAYLHAVGVIHRDLASKVGRVFISGVPWKSLGNFVVSVAKLKLV